MIIRLIVMVSLIAVLVTVFPHWGGAIGSVTFLVGMSVEAALAFWQGRKTHYWRPKPGVQAKRSPRDQAVLSVLIFLAPLLASGLINNLGRMLLNAGLARESVPPDVLAAFSVGWSLVWVVAALVWGLQQTVQVFADGTAKNERAISRFFVLVVLSSVLVIFLLSYTPAAQFALRRVMGTPENLVPGAVQTMRWLILLPVVLAWHEWNIGHLMLQRHTPVLFVGKAVNVSLVALTVGPGFKFLTGFGAASGAVATLLGHTGEGLVLTAGSWWYRRRQSRSKKTGATIAG